MLPVSRKQPHARKRSHLVIHYTFVQQVVSVVNARIVHIYTRTNKLVQPVIGKSKVVSLFLVHHVISCVAFFGLALHLRIDLSSRGVCPKRSSEQQNVRLRPVVKRDTPRMLNAER